MEFSPGTPDPGSRGIPRTPTSAYHISQIAEFSDALQPTTFLPTQQQLRTLHPLCAASLAFAYSAAVIASFFQSSLDTATFLMNPLLSSCTFFGIAFNSFLTYSTRVFTTCLRLTVPITTTHHFCFTQIHS